MTAIPQPRLKRSLRDALVRLGLTEEQAAAHADDLAGKIAAAWLMHGTDGSPNTAAVSKELTQIADLSAKLYRAVNRPEYLATTTAMTTKAGGLTAFRTLRRDALSALGKLHAVSNQQVAVRGRKVDRYAEAVADACAATYTKAIGKRPGRSVNPTTGKIGGPFYRLVRDVFAISRVKGKPATHVNRIAGRRGASR